MKANSVPFYLSGAFGLLGKDLKHSLRIPLGTLFLMFMIPMLQKFVALFTNNSMDISAVELIRSFLVVTAFALGLALTAEEEEEETSSFIHQLPLRPFQVIGSKFSAGMILLLGWCVASGAALFVAMNASINDIIVGLSFPLYGGDTILWGLIFGASLIVIGAAAGSWFGHRGLPFTALMGFCIMVGIILTTFYFYYHSQTEKPARTFFKYLYSMNANRARSVSFIVWIFLGVGTVSWIIREYTRQAVPPDFSLSFLKRKTDEDIDMGQECLFTPSLFMSPSLNFRLIGLPSILCAVAACVTLFLVSLFFDLTNEGINQAAILIGLCVLGPFLGSYACYKGERDRPHFLIHQLPVSFEHFQMHRLMLLGLSTMVCVIVLFVVRALILSPINRQSSSETTLNEEMLITLFFCIFGAVGTAFMGYLFRLFLKSFFVAFLICMVAMLPIVPLYAAVIHQSADIVSCIWGTVVLTCLPFLMIKFLTRRTTLLETGDGVRMWLGLFVAFWLLIWIAFLITLNPVDLWILLTA